MATLLRWTLCLLSIPALGLCLTAVAQPPDKENPYTVKRSWLDYFLEHQKLFAEQPSFYMHVR